ncbi:MAG: prepilin-type N-terminal cleavage/methylation domain-containing protein [Gemmataceae bacterium]
MRCHISAPPRPLVPRSPRSRSQTLFGNALPRSSASHRDSNPLPVRTRNRVSRPAFPNRVWERGQIRKGLSLLEVLVALTIFLFALIAISKLIDLGSQTAVEMDLRSQGASLAQSKLSEVIAGVVPLSSQSETPFDSDSDWVWTLDADQDDIPNLYRVKIVVSHDMPTGKVQVTLAQYVLDPNSRGSTEAPP